jgi:hypothetical protein
MRVREQREWIGDLRCPSTEFIPSEVEGLGMTAKCNDLRGNDFDAIAWTLGFAVLHQRPTRTRSIRKPVRRERCQLDFECQLAFAAGCSDDDDFMLAIERAGDASVNAQ